MIPRVLFASVQPVVRVPVAPSAELKPWVEDVDMDEGVLLTTQKPGHPLSLSSLGFAGCQGVVLMAYNPDTGQKSILLTHYGPMDFTVKRNVTRLNELLAELKKRQNLTASEIRLCLYVPDDSTYRHIRNQPPSPVPTPFDPKLVELLKTQVENAVGRFVETQVVPYDAFSPDFGTLDIATQDNPAAPFKVLIRGRDETRRFYPSA